MKFERRESFMWKWSVDSVEVECEQAKEVVWAPLMCSVCAVKAQCSIDVKLPCDFVKLQCDRHERRVLIDCTVKVPCELHESAVLVAVKISDDSVKCRECAMKAQWKCSASAAKVLFECHELYTCWVPWRCRVKSWKCHVSSRKAQWDRKQWPIITPWKLRGLG